MAVDRQVAGWGALAVRSDHRQKHFSLQHPIETVNVFQIITIYKTNLAPSINLQPFLDEAGAGGSLVFSFALLVGFEFYDRWFARGYAWRQTVRFT